MRVFVFLLVLVGVISGQSAAAQKFGYIDTEYIMSQMPTYTIAQKEADRLAEAWQKEIETMRQEIEKLERNFLAEEILLTDEMKRKRQQDIAVKKKDLRDYQNKVFGYNGTFFKKRQELIRPVQDEIAEAAEKVAKAKQLQFVLDNSGSVVIIYMNPTHDYTEYVLEELGIAPTDQNRPAATPANPVFDSPEDLPVTDSGEDINPQQNAPASRRQATPAAKKPTATAKKRN